MGREDEAFRLLKEEYQHYVDTIGKEVEILNGIADLLGEEVRYAFTWESTKEHVDLTKAKIRAGIRL